MFQLAVDTSCHVLFKIGTFGSCPACDVESLASLLYPLPSCKIVDCTGSSVPICRCNRKRVELSLPLMLYGCIS